MPKKLKNIRPWKGGWQAHTEIHGKQHHRSFPLNTSVADMRKWIKDERDKFATPHAAAGSFAAEIADYLTRVTAMVSYKQRRAHLALWVEALGGDRPRRSITTPELDRIMQGWLTAGLAARTVRKRRMSLLSMFNRLDGKDQPNPVRSSFCPREPKAEARAIDYGTVQRILDAMAPSGSKTRITVMAWTGLPPGMIAKIQPADLNLAKAQIRVRPRRKGAGVEARTLPLLPQGVAALRQFDREKLYGPYTIGSLNALFHRTCKKLTPPVTGLRVYDLRHAFGTMLYKVTKDLATVARFLLHANVAMSQRYALGAMQDVDRAAATAAGKYLSHKPAHRSKHRQTERLHV